MGEVKKYLDGEGLEHLLDKFRSREVFGMGLSHNDFSDADVAQLDDNTTQIEALDGRVSVLEEKPEALTKDEVKELINPRFIVRGVMQYENMENGEMACIFDSEGNPYSTATIVKNLLFGNLWRESDEFPDEFKNADTIEELKKVLKELGGLSDEELGNIDAYAEEISYAIPLFLPSLVVIRDYKDNIAEGIENVATLSFKMTSDPQPFEAEIESDDYLPILCPRYVNDDPKGWTLLGIEYENILASKQETLSSYFNSYDCEVEELNLSDIDVSNVLDMNNMFNCGTLRKLDVNGWDMRKVEVAEYMFESAPLEEVNSKGIKLSSATFGPFFQLFDAGVITKEDAQTWDCSKVESYRNTVRTDITDEGWSECDTKLQKLVPSFNVKDIQAMFWSCRSLTSLDLSNWNTQNLTDMSSAFDSCRSLTSLDLSNWNTQNLTDMSRAFSSCRSLTSLDLSSFDTSKVTNMSGMFGDCKVLTSLDLSKFDTSNVIFMNDMFPKASLITHIKCKQAFKDWCWANADVIHLPDAMREGGSGTWEIVE